MEEEYTAARKEQAAEPKKGQVDAAARKEQAVEPKNGEATETGMLRIRDKILKEKRRKKEQKRRRKMRVEDISWKSGAA